MSAVLSREVQQCLSQLGYTSLTVQCGHCDLSKDDTKDTSVLTTDTYQYKPCLQRDIAGADLVISHAGAGTCIEVLEAGKPLIVIVNDDLMDNHQLELAEKLSEEKYLVFGTVNTLRQTIESFNTTELVSYPMPDPSLFSSFVDKAMKIS